MKKKIMPNTGKFKNRILLASTLVIGLETSSDHPPVQYLSDMEQQTKFPVKKIKLLAKIDLKQK